LAVVESGQPYAKYPRAAGKKIIFHAVAKFPLNGEARKFYQLAGKAIQDCGCSLQFVHFKSDEKNSPTDERGRAL
jgi:hypothetical protein